ncbi:hypothetical protein [Halosolutus halophilus]|uniref:hypothetical protein n=1 Tax=Halosolutus halophilus TaxID=1552990 RepID=UPI0022352EFA|nr:hypothetical protein [Halosolutus halophilus]
MSDPSSFAHDSGAGLGALTLYSGLIFYFLIIPSFDFAYSELVLLFAIGPAWIVYETSKLFTGTIIEKLLEQHLAIARIEAELKGGSQFDDWYTGESKDEIDKLDETARKKITTILCSLTIGLTAPFFGYFVSHSIGIIIGLIIFILSVLIDIHVLRQVVRTIERFPKVIANEN